MASDAFTNEPKRPTAKSGSLTVEYLLHPEDHLALFMFIYDKARAERRSGARFWIKRILSLTSILAAYAYALGLGMSMREPWQSLICLMVLGFVVFCLLDTFWPSGLFSGFFRSIHQKQMMQMIRNGMHMGLLFNPERQDRVVMTEQYFIESNDLREDIPYPGVEITEHKETWVWWSAVSSIDVTEGYAFFTVTESGYLILPQTAFADEATFHAFVDTARDYREAALLTPAPRLSLPPSPNTGITS
ncbi:MAG TPA: hypothetical protein VN688_16085 [Gemmataceae bacterium]|nr:hypothetical protein [Gemmataceae bacterium]